MEGSFLAAQPCQSGNGCSGLFLWPELTDDVGIGCSCGSTSPAPPRPDLPCSHSSPAGAAHMHKPEPELLGLLNLPLENLHHLWGRKSKIEKGLWDMCELVAPRYGLRVGATSSSPCSPAHRTSSSREYPHTSHLREQMGTGLSPTEPLEPAQSEQVPLRSSGAWSSPVGTSGPALLPVPPELLLLPVSVPPCSCGCSQVCSLPCPAAAAFPDSCWGLGIAWWGCHGSHMMRSSPTTHPGFSPIPILFAASNRV